MNKTKMRNSQFGVWIDFRFSKDNLLATENSVSVQFSYYYELCDCHNSSIVGHCVHITISYNILHYFIDYQLHFCSKYCIPQGYYFSGYLI